MTKWTLLETIINFIRWNLGPSFREESLWCYCIWFCNLSVVTNSSIEPYLLQSRIASEHSSQHHPSYWNSRTLVYTLFIFTYSGIPARFSSSIAWIHTNTTKDHRDTILSLKQPRNSWNRTEPCQHKALCEKLSNFFRHFRWLAGHFFVCVFEEISIPSIPKNGSFCFDEIDSFF